MNGSLTTEGTVVLGVLLDLHLLGLSSQRRTISDTELTSDSDLLSSLSPSLLVNSWAEKHPENLVNPKDNLIKYRGYGSSVVYIMIDYFFTSQSEKELKTDEDNNAG